MNRTVRLALACVGVALVSLVAWPYALHQRSRLRPLSGKARRLSAQMEREGVMVGDAEVPRAA